MKTFQYTFSTFLLLLLAVGSATAQIKTPEAPKVKVPFEKSLQAVVVTTKGWDAATGTAAIFARKDAKSDWKQDGESFPVVVGSNGLAWASLQAPSNDAPVLGKVWAAVCDALRHKNDKALEGLYSRTTLVSLREDMRQEGIKSLSEFLKDDTSSNCYAKDEEMSGSEGSAKLFSSRFPMGIRVRFVMEQGSWKATNESPELELLKLDRNTYKVEGDSRSPAGLFPLTASFGIGSKPNAIELPYTKLDQSTECVDDTKSSFRLYAGHISVYAGRRSVANT